MNKLEQLQQEKTGIKSIKSYPMLNSITLFTPNDKNLIELVLSYQCNEQEFNMSYNKVCEILNIKEQTMKNIVAKLKKNNIIITDHKSNFNGINGGSSTALKINIDNLINLCNGITSTENKTTESTISTKEIVEDQKEEIVSEIEDNEVLKPVFPTNNKKEDMRIKFEVKMKYAKDYPITPATFHNLTNSYFKDKLSIENFYGLTSNDFEGFWNRTQELKEKLKELA